MAYLNGRLPKSALAPITTAVNGEQAYLTKKAAQAFVAMNAESEARFHVTLRVTSARVAYRSLADQQYFWDLYRSGKGALAATPGTSNHGWGVAVDLATTEMRDIVDKIGHQYGWAKEWSDAPTEWWHLKWREGVWDGKTPFKVRPVIKPGSVGKKVIDLKKALKLHGVDVDTKTPFYGPFAVKKVKALQKYHGLAADGIVGPSTWKVIDKKRANK